MSWDRAIYLGSVEVIRLDISGFIPLWFLGERDGSSDKTRRKETGKQLTESYDILQGTDDSRSPTH